VTSPILDRLLADIVTDGETLEDALEREARAIVLGGRAHQLAPIIDELMGLELTDRPYAQILVGHLANSSVPNRTDLTVAMLDAATATFADRDDRAGEAMAWWERGNMLLLLGDVAGASRAWQQAVDLDPDADLVEELSLASLAYGSFCVDGDLAQALTLAETAITISRSREHGRGEGLGLVFQGYLRVHAGDFELADQSFEAAERAFAAETAMAYESPLAAAGRGGVAGLRGHPAEADAAFAIAVERAGQTENAWLEAIIRTLRADSTLRYDSRRAHADCRFAIKVFDELGDSWWGSRARRARAEAALASDEIEAAVLLIEQLLPELDNPVERARCLITAGKAHLLAGNDAAASAAANEAVEIVSPTGANFVMVQALFLLAQSEPWRAPEAIERARALSTDDPAYLRLWASRPTLRLLLLGRQSVRVGDHEVSFRTSRAEHLVMILVLAGGRAVNVRVMSETLWPEARAEKLASNLSTATYDARQALGTEAWRLHRAGSQFWIDLGGAFVDLEDAISQARGIRPLGEPEPSDPADAERLRMRALDELRCDILPTLVFEPWVIEANQRRELLLELLGAGRVATDAR
jgi:tetratricopeptide (TPR) repeat protein